MPGTECRAAAGLCDIPETCTAQGTCPPDAFLASTYGCRASAGPCDPIENCTGTSPTCPADVVSYPKGTQCRASVGPCDVAESCDGVSPTCPSDQLRSAGFECRAASGACDKAEVCSGSSADCPADLLQSGGTVCRSSAGTCDVLEKCPGTSKDCPVDAFLPAQTSCGSSGFVCSGASSQCPTSCDQDTACNAGYYCGVDSCLSKKGDGAPCVADHECSNGTCGIFFADNDKDGYGNSAYSIRQCGVTPPSGYVGNSNDCCDVDANAHPGQTTWHVTARSVCGGFDYNCDGTDEPRWPNSGTCGYFNGFENGHAICVTSGFWHGSPPPCGVKGYTTQNCDTDPNLSNCLPQAGSEQVQECH